MCSLKSRESISIYQNTKVTVNGEEHQTSERLENGLIDSQQQSECYFNTTRDTERRPNIENEVAAD